MHEFWFLVNVITSLITLKSLCQWPCSSLIFSRDPHLTLPYPLTMPHAPRSFSSHDSRPYQDIRRYCHHICWNKTGIITHASPRISRSKARRRRRGVDAYPFMVCLIGIPAVLRVVFSCKSRGRRFLVNDNCASTRLVLAVYVYQPRASCVRCVDSTRVASLMLMNLGLVILLGSMRLMNSI
jgi:hypothetical protein